MRRKGARVGLALLAVMLGCSRKQPAGLPAPGEQNPVVRSVGSTLPERPAGDTSRLPSEERTWVFERTELGRMVAVVLLPERAKEARFPVLLAFHGRGEALKGPDRGARGWVDDYALGRALDRLKAPPLTASDFESFVTSERLARLNESLKARPFRGLVVVCPYTPDVLGGERPFEKTPPLARFVTEMLLPKVAHETPALGASATGIDGVSLGGRAAFGVGLLAPRSFRAIAGLQAAFDLNDAEEIARRAKDAHAQNPALVFRLLTSTDDYFREPDTAIVRSMQRLGLPAQLDVVVGPHDYAFNRGPGALEMLVYHDRVLRGEAPL
jgi:enterochelin esterase-like enzyme